MASYTNVFGGSLVTPAYLSYISYSLTALNSPLEMSWPTQFVDSANNVAAIIDLTSDGVGRSLTMPPATLVSNGTSVLFVNKGANTITINANDGVTLITTIDSGNAIYIYLTSNATANGIYSVIPFGGGVVAVVSVGAQSNNDNLTIGGSPVTGVGTFTFNFAKDILALTQFGVGTGFAARTAADTWALRSLTGTLNQISITNGAGVVGNPVFSFPAAVIFPGSVTLNQDAALPLQAVTLQQLNAVAPGRQFKDSVRAATTANLTANYVNGVDGVGATLTNAGALAQLSFDGIALVDGDRILIKNQNTTFQNGIYDVTSQGSGAVNWVITRSNDFDTASEMEIGSNVLVMEGTVNELTTWALTSLVTDVGVDAIIFAEFPILNQKGVQTIHQVAHGFVAGQWVYLNGAVYTLAIATAAATAEVVGVVARVDGVDDFVLQYDGIITGLGGLAAGTVYYLSTAVAGNLQNTAPVVLGQISKPLLIADSATSGYILRMRGFAV